MYVACMLHVCCMFRSNLFTILLVSHSSAEGDLKEEDFEIVPSDHDNHVTTPTARMAVSPGMAPDITRMQAV